MSWRFAAQRFIQWMQHPTLAILHLGGERELIVLLWQTLAIAFDHTAN